MTKSRVAILLDSSSSMHSIREEAIGAFNEQVTAIKKDAHELPTKISLVTFGTGVNEPILWNRRVNKLEPLNEETYVPNGMTALYDAMGTTINKLTQLPEASDPDTNFLIVVISDGAENNSKDYNAAFIKKRIEELEDSKRWTFSYIGANQDMFKVSNDLGIKLNNTLMFAADKIGTRKMSDTYACATTLYRNKLKKGVVGAEMDFLEVTEDSTTDGAVLGSSTSKSA